MLEKINFRNGVVLNSQILNELEKATVFNPRFPREDYYGQPSTVDNQVWYVGERDGIKDWEFSDPSLEPSTNIGRLAYDGLILGCKNCDTGIVELPEVEIGPPRLTYKNLDGSPLNVDPEIVEVGVIVNSGKFIDSSGVPVFWPLQVITVENNATNYIYIDYSDPDPDPIAVSNTSLPNQTSKIVPLARIDIAPADPENLTEAERITYTDLRKGLYIYSDTNLELRNTTPVINDDAVLEVWQRTFVDTANGSVNLTLPSSPVDGDRLAVYDISGTFDIYPPRVYSAQDDQTGDYIHTILNDYTHWDLNEKYSHNVFIYYEPLGTWILEQIPKGIESRENLGEFVSCGGRECIGVLPADQCINGSQIPPVFPQPSEGTYSYESSTSKCYKIINESIAIYADGEGEFIKIFSDPRCGRRTEALNTESRKTIFVDVNSGDDSLLNNGADSSKPFRTLERALLEAAKRDKPYTIRLSAGEYYVDNSPGGNSLVRPSTDRGYHNLVEIQGYTVGRFDPETHALSIIGDNQDPDVPPEGFTLGRTIYGRGGAFGTIVKMEKAKICHTDCGWRFILDGVVGQFVQDERLFYNDLAVINSLSGGVVVPNGTSIIGENLRGTIIRPMFVPTPDEAETNYRVVYGQDPAILKLTSNSYVSDVTVSDSKEHQFAHTGLTAFVFASERDMIGSDADPLEYSYYKKAGSLLSIRDLEDVALLQLETDIVNKTPADYGSRFEDTIENQTGESRPDYDPDRNEMLNRFPGPIDDLETAIPDVNSVNKGSPYVQNCAVKSIFGMSGMHADGALVGGFKSMLASNLTVVSVQVDPIAFAGGIASIENDPASAPINNPKKYKDDPRYRHYAYKASHEGYIQANSIYTVGLSDHVLTIDGGEITITGSTSNFGDIALRSEGYFPRAYTQDFATSDVGYAGTRITEIIPPKPVESYIDEVKVDTRLSLVLDPSRVYYTQYYTEIENPSVSSPYRIYVKSADNLVVFDSETPPSAKTLGVYNYTKPDEQLGVVLAGKDVKHNSISIDGIDGRRYAAAIFITNSRENDIPTDINSKVFLYDPDPPKETTALSSTFTIPNNNDPSIIEFNTSVDNPPESRIKVGTYLRLGGETIYEVLNVTAAGNNYTVYLDKEVPTGITSGEAEIVSNNIETGLWYIEVEDDINVGADFISNQLINASTRLKDQAPLAIIRDVDKRSDVEKIFRIKLEGYSSSRKIRKPPENYIVEKQLDLDPDRIFNSADSLRDRDPLVITNVVELSPDSGEYLATLVFESDAYKSTTTELYPTADPDDLTVITPEDITRNAINDFITREIYIDGDTVTLLDDSETSYSVQAKYGVDPDISAEDLRIELRRPSTIRASSHTWEWVGYLNYDSALPRYQGLEFDHETNLKKLFTEIRGGRVFSNGMDHSGKVYLNGRENVHPESVGINTYQTQFLSTERPSENIYVNRELYMSPGSSLTFDAGTQIQFNGPISLVSENGSTITETTRDSVAGLLADTERAGLIQITTSDELGEYLDKNSPTSGLLYKAVTPDLLRDSKATTGSYGLTVLTDDLTTVASGDGDTTAVTPNAVLNLFASDTEYGLTKNIKVVDNILRNYINQDTIDPDQVESIGSLTVTAEGLRTSRATSTDFGLTVLTDNLTTVDSEDEATTAVTPNAVLSLTATSDRKGITDFVSLTDLQNYLKVPDPGSGVFPETGVFNSAISPDILATARATTTHFGLTKLVDDIIPEKDLPQSESSATPKAVYDYVNSVVDTESLKYINNLRMSHVENTDRLTDSNGSDENTSIYLHPIGGNIALRHPTTYEWRLSYISGETVIETDLNSSEIKVIDTESGSTSGSIQSNTLYYIYAYLDSLLTIKLAASTTAPTLVDGVMSLGLSTNRKYRYLGKLHTAGTTSTNPESVVYKQHAGGRLGLHPSGGKPSVNLVNYENRVVIALKYLLNEAEYPAVINGVSQLGQQSLDSTYYLYPDVYTEVLIAENSIVRGRLLAINYYKGGNNSTDKAVVSVFPVMYVTNLTTDPTGTTPTQYDPLSADHTYFTLGLTSANRTIVDSSLEYVSGSDAELVKIQYATKWWNVITADGSTATDTGTVTDLYINDGVAEMWASVNVGMIIETEI